MSDLDDLFTDSDGKTIGGKLREQLEAALAERNTLKEQLAQVQAKQRETEVSTLFSKHQIPELARDFFPKDAALTDESATAFVEKYGQLWGATAVTATTPPEQQAAASTVQTLASQSAPPPAQPMSAEQYQAKFAEAQSKADLMRMIAEFEPQAQVYHLGDE